MFGGPIGGLEPRRAFAEFGAVEQQVVPDEPLVAKVDPFGSREIAAVREVVGDVDTADVISKCKLITPVPGGIGPLTVAVLMQNTLVNALKAYGMSDIVE